MNILIATPAYERMVHWEYMVSVVKLIEALRQVNVPVTLAASGGALLDRNRNLHASQCLNGQYTHLLFIDADMAFEPSLVLKMLRLGQPFVGALYPFRASHGRFVGQSSLILEDGKISVRDGFVRSRYVGTGVLLLERAVLEKMRDGYPELYLPKGDPWYAGAGESGPILQCFTALQGSDGVFEGEDASFCSRWVGLDGEIWANVDETIEHYGQQRFSGRALDALRSADSQG